MTSLIGRRLGRYELRAELGRGGMARVYRALDTLLQRQVAIKVLAAQLSMDPEFVRRFDREATTAANLRHPAIVTIYDVDEQDGLHYIAMEFVDGRSLHAVLEEHTTLGLGYAVSILGPVAEALDFAHAKGAIHRDIKPHNILIDHDGRVLLTDFGIAQTPDSDGERLTRTGIFMGTPEYISPEQAEARRVDGRSDLYALGVVAYEIITGRVPFAGATPQLIVAHSQLPPPPPTSVVAHLPGELDEVLAKALAKRPERRYPSGQALVEALRSVATRYGTPLATREQVAALTDTAGVPPQPPIPQPVPSPPARPAPVRPEPVRPAPRQQTPSGRAQATPAASGPRPQSAPRPAAGTTRAQAPPAPRPQTGASRGYGKRRPEGNQLPLLLIGLLLVLLTGTLIFLAARSLANGPVRFPTTPPASATPALPGVAPPTVLPTGGLSGTALPVTTATPSATAATPAPTAPSATLPTTAAPPTLAPPRPTQPPAATVTPPPAVATSSATPEPPTLTPSPEPPTLTPTATATATLTATATPTEEPPILDGTPIFVGTSTPAP